MAPKKSRDIVTRSTVRKVLKTGIPAVTKPRPGALRRNVQTGAGNLSASLSGSATGSRERASSAPPPSTTGNDLGASASVAATTKGSNTDLPKLPATGCPLCGRKPPGRKARGNANRPPTRRSPRGHPGSPPDGLVKRDGWINDVARIPQGVIAGRIAKRFPKVRTPYTKGFANPDALSCYRNAPLQCLLHIPAFYNYLGNIHKDCALNADSCTVCALQNLAHVYWEEGVMPESDTDVHTVDRTVVDDFTAACIAGALNHSLAMQEDFEEGRMSDPYEFACYLAEELKAVQTGEEIISCQGMLETPRVENWTCKECGHVNPVVVPADLGIGLQTAFEHCPTGNLTLTQCLRLNTFRNFSQRRCNGRKCAAKYGGDAGKEAKDKDNKTVEGAVRIVRTKLTQLPEVLVIRIGRFRHDASLVVDEWNNGYVKDQRIVRLEEYLSLQPWSADDQDRCTYRLDGIVGHGGGGDSVNGGHYVAVVRTVDGTMFELINDNYQLENRRFAQVQTRIDTGEDRDEDEMFDPYMLVYSRV